MLIGHRKQWQFLKKSAELEKIPHALLFYGQSHLGKRTLAMEFIKFLDCQNLKNRPCQSCRVCQDIQKGQHPDLIMITPVKKEIQIFQIRDLIWKLSLHPYSAPFKAAIIDQAHLMTSEAQNCFLKTLEEPRGKTLLILITEYPEMLFSTILSRVQKIKFYPVERKEIENYLITQGVPKEKTKLISQLSLGKPGVALEFVLDNQKLEKQDKIIKEILKIGNSDLVSRFQYAKDLAVNSEDTREVLEIWLRYFRNALILTVDKKEKIYSLSKLKNILRTIQKINFLISTTNVNPKLALEILLLEL